MAHLITLAAVGVVLAVEAAKRPAIVALEAAVVLTALAVI